MLQCMSDSAPRQRGRLLTFDDIDWRLRIDDPLMLRGRVLPLPTPLGQAITAYLRCGRPSSTDRHLFLRHTFLPGKPVTHDMVRGVFRRAYAAPPLDLSAHMSCGTRLRPG